MVAYKYPRPAVTVDTFVGALRPDGLSVLLIRRAQEPFVGCWALPGGFVDPQEPLETAARRELVEETGVTTDTRFWPVGGFGDPGRDPRGWTVSLAYYTLVEDQTLTPKASDDADEVGWHLVDRLPKLAFDHRKIITATLARMRSDLYSASVADSLLPKKFTIKDLAQIYRRLDPQAGPVARLKRRLIDAGVIAPATPRSTASVKSAPVYFFPRG